ncbi:LOW QUALITY PROTEIN: uncharacterized protein LOC128718400 [Anopheles marshallii]|uniref:LOW QUALITY PROTEIN: uncharacterized protein LOC128718400 n=1 Tax=Anopheles marshallii TaxID=1521116 RepID=UPI00237C1834|nr:LOW QUALITY PROTEIN: uncharacterized protein LOC128718400 [Anopheles marshallii]
MHGNSYHLRMAMVILLRAINLRREGKFFDFTLSMEDPNAGKFDDVVFRYPLSSTPKEFASVYIQAKHKQVKKTSITKDALLTKWNTSAQFSIPKYFTSYLHGYDPSLKGSHTYILCTNQSFDKNLRANFIPREPNTDHILSFCNDIGATCYSFDSETEIESLKDELRMASLEKLGCMIAFHVFKKRHMQSSIYLFNMNVNLIAKCVDILGSGTFQFNKEFRAADESTVIGRLRSSFEQEYIKLTRKNEINWENVSIMVDGSFSESIRNTNKNSLYGYAQYYETVDVIIQQFFDKFMFVCGSMDDTQLFTKIINIMPPWMSNRESTYSSLHNLLFNSMNKSTDINWQDLKQHFVDSKTNESLAMVQSFTHDYLRSMHVSYSDINVEPNRLNNTALHDFVNDTSRYDVYRYRHTMNMQVNCLIVAQTLGLDRCLFMDITSSKFNKMFDVIYELMEFFAAVDLSSKYIITILGQQEGAVLGAIRQCTKLYKTKIIIVEESTEDDLSKGRLLVSDLTEEARAQLYQQHDHFNLFGTTSALDVFVRDNDSLSLLFCVLDKCDKTEMAENLNVKNFEKIQSWYIPRCSAPYSEGKQESEPYLVEQEITAVMLQSIISRKHEASRFPEAFNSDKIHIFFNEAGYGKSTYFTWLASALSKGNASLCVIRMNALQYASDFNCLQHLNPKTLDDTEIIRIFYRLWHMTLIIANINYLSMNETKQEGKKVGNTAQHLNISKGTIVIDEGGNKEPQLSFEQLLQLRLFQSKFNRKQLVCLLDGVDEIAPHYKDFVMAYFARLATLRGIRNLCLSTRPYNFRYEFKHTFSGCKMWRLVPFSQTDRILFMINHLEREMEEYKTASEDLQLQILKNMYTFAINSIPDLKIIPLYLHMAANITLSEVKTRQNVQEHTLSTELFEETKFDQFQIISYFVDEKLRILNNEKAGNIEFASTTPIQITRNNKTNNLLKSRHALLAMSVIFNKKVNDDLFSKEESKQAVEFMQEVIESEEKAGFIREIRDGEPKFSHRIFAEYFAACWIYDNKQRIRSEIFFRSWEYWGLEAYRTRDFLNRLIVRDCASERSDIHIAVINQSEHQVRELLSNDSSVAFMKDAIGRLPLHLAVMYPSFKIQKLLIEKMSPQSINTKDELLEWTALDYAFAIRSSAAVNALLTVGADVNGGTLLKQTLSNKLKNILFHAHEVIVILQIPNFHDHFNIFVKQFLFDLIENLITEKNLNILVNHKEFENFTILQFCSKYNMIGLLEQFLSRVHKQRMISTNEINQLYQIASENKAHDIVVYLTEQIYTLLPQLESIPGLIFAVRNSIHENYNYIFEHIFNALCLRLNIRMVDIVVSDYAPDDDSIPPLREEHYPKPCCVLSAAHVGMSLPEYDEKDILNEGYVIEALLATAVHEGNLQMVKYIVQKIDMAISNRIIVMVMRLLPKQDDVCHEKSMDAYSYLLEKTTDRESTDDQGRNLLHMAAQNGCFFMMRCLIAKGFDPAMANISNGWNVFHYVAFNQDGDRTDKILKFLLINCYMHWYDDLDRMVGSDSNLQDAFTHQNTQSSEKLNKQQYALIAMFAIFSQEDIAKLLSDQEQQEATQCLQKAIQGNEKTGIIQQVRDGIPKFAQATYAQYFAACWIYDNKHRMRSESFFRSWTFWTFGSSKYQTRDFLNRLIVKNNKRCDLHMAVINQLKAEVRKLLSEDPTVAHEKDPVGRLPLHLAVAYPSEQIVNMLIEKMPLQAVNTKDELFQWTALDYAFANRYEHRVQRLLTVGAVVDEDSLLQQILSNNLRSLIWNAHYYGNFLNSHESSKIIVNRLHDRSVQYLLYEKHLDVFARHKELGSLTVLEYCSQHNMIGVFKHVVSQSSIRARISTDLSRKLFQIASKQKAHDIKAYFVDENNTLLPQMKTVAELISALKSCINRNQMSSFKDIFHALCLRLNIRMVDDTDIVVGDYAPDDDSIPPLREEHYPKPCCVLSAAHVGMSLPEYDEKDILNEGYVIEALLATAVHEGNLQMVKYIVQKIDMAISNRIIVMVMRLLPKQDDVCHEKSMDAFSYLLEKTTDRESTDDQGRNLLHMAAQNGCFFMMRCLIAKGFNPAMANISNGWNVFHYVAFNQDGDRTDKILKFLLINCYMHWYDDLDRMVGSDSNLQDAFTHQNTQSSEKLNKQQYALIAMFAIFSQEDIAKLLSDQEQQEATQCLQKAIQGNEKTGIIQQVRDGIPKFAQATYAQYFAACWIYDNKHRMRSESFFRSWTFWTFGSSKYQTRDFLNRLIVKNNKRCDLHMAVINQLKAEVRKLLSEDPTVAHEKDPVGRLPLHLAVAYPSEQIVNMLIEKMPLQAVNTKDELFQWTALDYAFASRYKHRVQRLLTVGAVVDEDNLLQQILSNNLRSLIWNAHYYGNFLNSHESSKIIVNRLHDRSVQYLLYEKHLDVFARHKELGSLTVLELCSKHNMIDVFKHVVSQSSIRARISTDLSRKLFQIASKQKAHDIKAYFVDENNTLLPQMKTVAELISALKSCINRNQMSSFKDIFHTLCLLLNFRMVDDTDIVVGDYAPDDDSIPPLREEHYPKPCCVLSAAHVGMSLPEYDEKDILNEGYVIEALLATAVHEGNLQMVKYIVQKIDMAISNRIIVMVMRLLPKQDDVCHEKSMDAFSYLLEKTTDRESTDDQGRNLLHMAAQNGCFFMMRCLIAKGFDPAMANISNGWNVFHYVAFNQDGDRTDKILKFLLINCYMHWYDDLDRMVGSDSNLQDAFTHQNTQSSVKLNKQQYALIAMFAIFSQEDIAKLLSDQEQQEATQCLQKAIQGNEKTGIIQQVRDGIPKFAQATYAQYFAACWIYDNKHRMRSESFFRSWTFWTFGSSKYQTRDFLNRLIVKNNKRCDLHMAVINQLKAEVRKLLSEDPTVAHEKDPVGRLPLHLAVAYPSEQIVNMLIEKMPLQAVNTKDELFQWTALDYAFASRYKHRVQRLLTVGAVVDEDNLLQQILSNNLRSLIWNAHYYGNFLNSHESSKIIVNRLHDRSVQYLLYEKHLDVFARHKELGSLTVLEYCSQHNMIGVFKHVVSQSSIRARISTDLSRKLFQIASKQKAHDIKAYFVDENNTLLPQMKTVAELISALKSCINRNQMSSFKDIFHALCLRLNIRMVDDTDIVVGDYAPDDDSIPPLREEHYPKPCCVLSAAHVGMSLPEYDEKDILNEGYVIEALLATAVHEGNLQMVKYIVQKIDMAISNRIIVMVMRLLPKQDDVCHEKSMDAFSYLLEKTTDRESTDDQGRNLLHMAAQNGCFFMMRCLIAKGFNPAMANISNGWNVFHYIAFNQDGDRTDKILKFLLINCYMHWYDDLDRMVGSDSNLQDAFTHQNTQSSVKLNKQQYALIAMFAISSQDDIAKLLSDQEQQEATQCLQKAIQGNEKTGIIQQVRDGIPKFAQATYAQYFAACWIYDNKHRMRSESFFRSWTFWTFGNSEDRTRDFLNRLIVKNNKRCDLHMAVINQLKAEVRKLLSEDPTVAHEKDPVGRLPLHLAVTYPSEQIVNMLIEKMPLQAVNTKDELFQWTALDYAFASRYKHRVQRLLTVGAVVDEDNLFQQILSNNLRSLIWNAHYYGNFLNSHESSKIIVNRLHDRSVQYLLYEKHLDVFARHKELGSLTVLEYCSQHNMIDVFKHVVSQSSIRARISTDLSRKLFKIASKQKAHDIKAYFVDENNTLLPQMKTVAELISALKSCINRNQMSSFKDIFHALCLRLNIRMVDDTDIVVGDYAPDDDSIPPLREEHYPKPCCVLSAAHVGMSLPEYDEKDILNEGYVIEALLATAVHEGNLQMVKYIVQKIDMAISNRIIVMVMRLLPKQDDVCHEKSMDAFSYLLEKTTDRESTDDQGRNLLHMAAQNGCFFMMRCLIAKGFDPAMANISNGWNVFHYIAFNQDGDRTDKILKFLLINCYMHWYDDLDRMVGSDSNLQDAFTHQNTQSSEKLNKQQYALIAMFAIFSQEDIAKLLSDQEQQEATQCLQKAIQGNEKTGIIQQVRDGIPKFAQATYAQYFAACWIYDNKHRMRSESFFRSWTFWTFGSSKYQTRDFLNRLIVKNNKRCDLHMAVINQLKAEVRKLLSEDPTVAHEKDPVGRLPLHLAVAYPSEQIVNMLIEKMPLQAVNTKDELFQWTALDYAFASRYKHRVQRLLTVGAVVDEDNLLQQILSNNLRSLIWNAHYYGNFLNSHESSKIIVNRLHDRSVQYLLYEKHLDVFARHKELGSLTVLELCSKHNMIDVFKHVVSQSSIRARISTDLSRKLFQIASKQKAHDIKAYFVDENNTLLPQMKTVAELISALKSCINRNQMSSFKDIFHALCLRLNIRMVDDTDIVVGDYAPDDDSIPPLHEEHYPKPCCVLSAAHVGMSLPEYDEKDILNEGYVIEALLATAVHEGNLQMVKYIVQKIDMAISNRIIVMVMRLLPKQDDVCHEKSMDAYSYLLEKTTDRESTDDQGRNLLHMTAQNGCFFMMHCLIAKGFDPSEVNQRNGYDVFNYVDFDQDEDRKQKKINLVIEKMRQ